MKRPVQAALLLLSGLGLLQAALFSDLYLRYVKAGMKPLLIASGVILLGLGAAQAWTAFRKAPHEGEHPPPRVAWLLFLPALSLLLYAPPSLGAYTAARETPRATPADVSEADFDPLPATSPLPITLGDFTHRVQEDHTRVIEKRTVLMTGFATPAAKGDGWDLTRLIINCCAADAQSVKVRMYGHPAPRPNTWVTVTGTWHRHGTLGAASAEVALDVRTLKKVPRPTNSYMDALLPG
ncbi:TIGR03943 family putative permease subunit [Streptomyces sp. NPDC059575]|uniref:TIGR03943 family putative permease subunit n=1 Tax=Streptomyces sp. NPDC059575 TaxID=3346872 RepID=UPI00369F1ED2